MEEDEKEEVLGQVYLPRGPVGDGGWEADSTEANEAGFL